VDKQAFCIGLAWFILTLFFSGCAATIGEVSENVKPIIAGTELSDGQLLDVTIEVFESEELSEKEKDKLGMSEEIRQAEERFIPIHLMYTMQRSGYWGAVRVAPSEDHADVQVQGKILTSDGERLSLEVTAFDARGRQWFERTYTENLEPSDHDNQNLVPQEHDPFQDLYNTIANDLVEFREQLNSNEFREIREVSRLRFAEGMAPDAFGDYLERDASGLVTLKRLPAEDDPMLRRVDAIKVRDEMLLDTINSYYDAYYQDLWQPYTDWRRLHAEEVSALRELESQALTRQLLGLASIIGGVVLSTGNNSISNSSLPNVMVLGGAAAIYSGFEKRQETKIHKDVIEELSASFSSEAEPLVVEVIGETVRLSGSAEQQYAQWRTMLRDIYANETGFLVENDLSVENDNDQSSDLTNRDKDDESY
jgi:hypothetical protein